VTEIPAIQSAVPVPSLSWEDSAAARMRMFGLASCLLLTIPVVAQDDKNRAKRIWADEEKKAYAWFDTLGFPDLRILYHAGRCLVHEPWARRREMLAEARQRLDAAEVLFSEGVVGQGRASYATALAQGHEGVMAKHLASTYRPGRRVKLWDPANVHEVFTLKEHETYVWSVVFSPNGHYLASCAIREDSVKVWDVASGQGLLTFTGHSGGPRRAGRRRRIRAL
jgi:hypothetical protein